MSSLPRAASLPVAALLMLACAGTPGFAQTAEPAATSEAVADDAEEASPEPLTEDELEVLVARIALYPDDLVSLVIASSLYPLQIVQAARYLEEAKQKPELKPSEKWDGSVVSLLNYPDVLKMMNDDLDWTEQLGEAAVNQQKGLLVAIQQLRDQAVAKDVLKSTDKVVVEKVNDNVVIKSADPEVVYVPTYQPEMLYEPTYVAPAEPIVYSNPYPSYYYPAATYWAGAVTGAVWASVVDWDDWGVWGGDVDIDVDVGDRIDIDFDNKIDIDKIDVNKLKKVDWKKVDRSKIDVKNVNVNKNKLKANLERNSANKITNKVKDRPGASVARKPAGKDVRKNVEAGLKSPGRPNPPKGKSPAAKISRPAAKPAVAKKPNSAAIAKKQIAKPKPAARVDNRPKKPSVMGNPGKGKVTKVNSNRGAVSRGGGFKGGSLKGGGGHRSFGGGGRRR